MITRLAVRTVQERQLLLAQSYCLHPDHALKVQRERNGIAIAASAGGAARASLHFKRSNPQRSQPFAEGSWNERDKVNDPQ